ncbi:hypothetical protein [Myxococcus xanthus]|uniref:hypothetical protein n=1 Tax=Myxococcus xanthus TaxID=34 RepID=UPI00112C631B|nr:hypothetical protein [Myxococcus xanthus]QDE96270.1 hypothetical protein BHS05_10690 [Myxococcus xanthus]
MYRSNDGLQNTRWGMPPEDVKALYPEAWMTSPQGDLRVHTQVAERPATLDFVFVQDKLAAVSVSFDLEASLRDEFNALSRPRMAARCSSRPSTGRTVSARESCTS